MEGPNTTKPEAYEYPPMDEERRQFLDYVLKMYAGQEEDTRFDATGEITLDLPGLEHFIVKKYVYSPEHVNVAMAWPEYISQKTKDKAFLDMGTGTGIAAVYVALNGEPSHVTATDISPLAVENCKANAEQYHLEEPFFSIRESDVFSAIQSDEKFDVMFWNFPWNAPDQDIEEILREHNLPVTPEKVTQLRAGLDKQYEALRRFIGEGKQHLNPGGEMLLGAGGPSRHDIIKGEAEKHGYNIETAEEREMIVDKIGNAKLKVILYRLTPREV
jgi:methylase of polypeptide subunit release factors